MSIADQINAVETQILETRRLRYDHTNYYMSSKTHDLIDDKRGECWEFYNEDDYDWQAWTQTIRCKATGKTETVLLAGWGHWQFAPTPKVETTSYFAGDFVAKRLVKPKHDCARFRAIVPIKELGRAPSTEEGVNALRSIMDGFEEDAPRPDFLHR